MPTLYVTVPRSVVRHEQGLFVVTLDEETSRNTPRPPDRQRLMEVKPHRLDSIILVGSVHITGSTLGACHAEGIDVAWLSRQGRFRGRTVAPLSRTADLRLRQFRHAEDPAAALCLARTFVEGKVRNGIAMVRSIRSNRPGETELGEVISGLQKVRERLRTAKTAETILGIEGDAARRYFTGLRIGFSGPITFESRKQHPSPDPANALLSLCYVLLTNLTAAIVEARGLDPYLGFFHAVRSGKPSLALDLIEELRHPVVDRFVLRLCNRKQLSPSDFEADGNGGVRLRPDSFRRFLTEWEQYLDQPMAGVPRDDISIRQTIVDQVDRLAAHLREKKPYEPLLLKGA